MNAQFRFLTILLLTLLFSPAAAQQTLHVNGWLVPDLRLDLLPGVSYAPAIALAEALGAELLLDSNLVTLRLAGRTAQLRVSHSVPEASAAGAFRLNGEANSEPGALASAGIVYLPVRALTSAFGGYITELSGAESGVVAVLPRGTLQDVTSRRDGNSERISVSLSAAVPYSVFLNEPLNTLHIRFERTESSVRPLLEGAFYRQASVVNERGGTELRIALEPATQYSVFAVQQGRGYQLVVHLTELSAGSASSAPSPVASWRVVLDPGTPQSESDPALELLTAVAAELERQGMDVHLLRSDAVMPSLAGRSAGGSGADLFLSVSVTGDAAGSYALYYLGDAQGGELLEQSIRLNAETALPGTTDQLRRQVLLGLVPDLQAGQRLAESLQRTLHAQSALQGGDVRAAPLQVLAGAGGRGVLLELAAVDAADPALPALLALGISSALRGQ